MDESALPFGHNFGSQEGVLDSLHDWGYRVECTPWDVSDLPGRAQELIGAMILVSHYGDGVAPFQAFLIELDVPHKVKRIRRTDLRIILDPFYRRYPQGEYLFIFALPDYTNVALVSPKRIRREEGLAPKLQLRILTLDPSHLYHTDLWVLREIRLEPHEQKADAIWRKHLAAFDVERVTRRFYEDYKEVLATLKGELTRQRRVGAKPAEIHAFAQQLLNRLMFLYFVQKKGWLRWGDGTPDTHYLASLWRAYGDDQRQPKGYFYAHWLRPLFLDAFNKRIADIRANTHLPPEIKESFLRVPYLNGGLFEENKLDALDFSVPNGYFGMLFDRFQKKEPGFLERYNFTVDESTPLEVEVAVDPEMLGKVYESLIAEEERHRSGIFYTPRAEIDYMCRLALIEYLHDQTDFSKDDLIPLVMDPYRLMEGSSVQFPGFSAKRLRKIDKALEDVRVVDPTVGSGSFLVGMMRVLVELQKAIARKLERKRFNEFDLKRRTIMENLYGVDVKEWAVRVCELRLWLSLTIEAEERDIGLYTSPVLPKLSFRVRCGDSLVEEVAGIPLVLRRGEAMPGVYISPRLEHRLNKLAEMKADYFGGRSPLKPEQIEREESKLLQGVLNAAIDRINRQLDALRTPLEEQAAFKEMEVPTPKQLQLGEKQRKRQIRTFTQQRKDLIKVRRELGRGKTPPFFLWDVGFGEVFAEKGGFDIVIGNPPYVRQEEIGPPTENPDDYGPDEWRERKGDYKDRLDRGVQALWGSALKVSRRSDLYVYFYHGGLSLLREGGVFCFINSNSWLDVGYGADLQEFLLRRMRILQVIDNHARRSFEADINTIIVLLQRPETDGSQWQHVARFIAYRKPFEEILTVSNLLAIERATEVTRTDDLRVYPITQRDLLLDGADLSEEEKQTAMDFAALDAVKYQGGKWGGKFLRAPDIFFTILERGKGKLVRLGDIAEVRFGIKTGANDFFYLEPTGQPAPEGLVHVRNGAGWEGYLEAEYLKPMLFSLKECPEIRLDPRNFRYLVFLCRRPKSELRRLEHIHVLSYIAWGENQTTRSGDRLPDAPSLRGRQVWYALPEQKPPDFISNRFIGERFLFVEGSDFPVCDVFFIGYFNRHQLGQNPMMGLAILNSTLTVLVADVLGRKTYGIGVMYLYGPEVNGLLLLDPAHLTLSHQERLLQAFDQMCRRDIHGIFEELGLPKPNRDYSNINPNDVSLDKVLPDRRALDQVVFEALGLTEKEQLEVYRAVVELVKNRLAKARSV